MYYHVIVHLKTEMKFGAYDLDEQTTITMFCKPHLLGHPVTFEDKEAFSKNEIEKLQIYTSEATSDELFNSNIGENSFFSKTNVFCSNYKKGMKNITTTINNKVQQMINDEARQLFSCNSPPKD